MHSSAAEFMAWVETRSPGESEFHQAVAEVMSSVWPVLQRKPEYAEAIRAVDIDDTPVKAFAEKAGLTTTNAGVRLFRAREALRKQVTASCGTCADHGCLDCSCGRR